MICYSSHKKLIQFPLSCKVKAKVQGSKWPGPCYLSGLISHFLPYSLLSHTSLWLQGHKLCSMNEWFWNSSFSRRKRGEAACPWCPGRDLNPGRLPNYQPGTISVVFSFLLQKVLWLNLPWPPTKVFKFPSSEGGFMLARLFLARRVAHFLLCEIQWQKRLPFKRQRKKRPGHQIVLINTSLFLRRKGQAWLSFSQLGLLCGVLFMPRDAESEFHGNLDKLLRVVGNLNLSAKCSSFFCQPGIYISKWESLLGAS